MTDMNYKLTLFLPFFMLFSFIGWSQIPEDIIARNMGQPGTVDRLGCADQFAGTINFDPANFYGMSDDVAGTRKFFCFNDFYQIIHNGDADLTGDPDTDTDAGIGYAWYTERPTISGPNLTTILTDPMILKNPVPPSDIWVYTDDINGDAIFANKKNIPDALGQQLLTIPEWANNGDPIEIWYAPITYDALVGGIASFEQDNGGASGPCVNVNIDQAFSIVYLTRIEASNETNDATGGSFTVEGGLPHWDNTETYSILIEYTGNPSITGTITSGPASHGDLVTYTLPQVGSYDITISDGKSCGRTFRIRASDGNPLFNLEAGNEIGEQGDEICIQITSATAIDNLVGFQFGINYDPTVLEFVSANKVSIGDDFNAQNDGSVVNTIYNLGFGEDENGVNINSGDALIELCFKLIGDPGECSDIDFVPLSSGSINEVVRFFPGGSFQQFKGDFISYSSGSGCIEVKGLHGIVTNAHGNCGNTTVDKGEFTVDVKEGTPPYSFSWQECGGGIVFGPIAGESINVTSIAAGTYCYTITDSANPSASFIDTVILVDGPSVGAALLFDEPSCKGKADGQVCVDVSENGTVIGSPEATYDFVWEYDKTKNARCLNEVPAGSYKVKVINKDSGCFDIATGSLTEPAGMTIDNIDIKNPTCDGDTDGQISLSISGGKMPYNFNWSDTGTGGPVHPGIGAGTYYVSITDGDNCQEIIDTFILVDPSPIVGNFSNLTPVTCFNGIPCDGGATVTATGGDVGVYDFSWGSGEITTGATMSSATQLCQGMQLVTITDGVCAIEDTVMIEAPERLAVDMAVTSSMQTSCFGGSDGSAIVGAGGGQGPYTYQWNLNGSSQTGNSVSGLSAGTYQVVITDAVGCSIAPNISVTEPDSLIAFVDTAHSRDVSCGGEGDGQISVAWNGGNPGLATYNISGGQPSNISVFTGLSPGDYTITVTDVKGCSSTTMYSINEPAPVVANILPPEEPQCAGYRTLITVDGVIGGQGPGYTYSVDNGPALDITTPTPVFAGDHTIIVYDENGCEFDTMLVITEPAPVEVVMPSELNLELGENDIIVATFSSEYALDTVTWTPTDYLTCGGNDSLAVNCLNPTISPLESTLYTITTTDLNGCVATAEIYVRVDKDRNVFIPNVFTPNGDGINDIFTPVVTNGVTNVNFMKIFDRWGTLVYQQDDFLPLNSFSTGWDGYHNGKSAEPGVYIYLIEVTFLDEITLLYRGDITLLAKDK